MLHVLIHHPDRPYAVGPFSSYGQAITSAARLIERRGDRFSIVTTRPEDGLIHGWPYHDPYPVRSVELFDLGEAPNRYYVIHHDRPKGPFVVGPFVDYRDAYAEALLDLGLDAGSYGPLPSDVSIVEATPKDGRIGRCTIYPPRPID